MPQAPIFEGIFGIPWTRLPPVMQKHYAIRPDSDDRVTVEGTLNIRCSRMIRLAAPLLKLLGALVPYNAENVAVTVAFYCGRGKNCFHFDRLFRLPGKPTFRFHSRVEPIGDGELVEFMRCGIGWRCIYRAEGNRVILEHRGYVCRIGGKLIPLPLALFLGKGAAEEEAVDENTFRMWMSVTHPLFGENYRYEGTFRIAEVSCA